VRPECPYCGGLSSTFKLHDSISKRHMKICWACKQYENKHGFLVPPEERGGHRGTRQWGPQEAWRKEVKFRSTRYNNDWSTRTRSIVCIVAGDALEGPSGGLSERGKQQAKTLLQKWNRPIDLLVVSPEKHVFETAQILELDEIPGHVLDLVREFQSPYPCPTKNELYEFAELEFTTIEFPGKRFGATINGSNGDLMEVHQNSHAAKHGVTNDWSIERVNGEIWDKVTMCDTVKEDIPYRVTFRKSLKEEGWIFDEINDDDIMESSGESETPEQLKRRILEFSKWLRNRHERHIVVLGHPKFLSYMMYGANFSLEPCRCYEWRF